VKMSMLASNGTCRVTAGILDTFGSQRLQLGGPVHMETLTLLHAFAGLSGAQKVSEVRSCW
jgi:hypothetical protein